MKSRIRNSFMVLVFLQLVISGLTFAKTVITPSDFTFVGGFRVPGSMTYASGLTHRYIDGQLYFYSVSGVGTDSGNTHRFQIPETLDQTYPFDQVSASINYGDIFQDKLVDVVSNGSGGSPPYVGIAGGATRPNGVFWDEQDQRLYWTKVVNYNTTRGDSDAALGYSNLDDTNHTGTGIASWKLAPSNDKGGFGNRWAFSMTPIPQTIADTYLGGRRLGVGFGGGTSILSNGPPSMGPALFAITPPDLANEDHLDYMSTLPIEMLSHFSDATWAARPVGETVTDLRGHSGSLGDSSYWFSEDKSQHGVWIDTPDKHGLITFAHIGRGNADTTVLDNPAPTSTVFAVADSGDIQTGDIIRVDTSVIRTPSYPWQLGRVLSVSGNTITLESSVPGTPTVGGRVVAGDWYDAGAPATSRFFHYWYIYDPDDLVQAVTGPASPNGLTPTFYGRVDLIGVDYPLPGIGPGATRPYEIRGATFDSNTNRLYLAVKGPSFGQMEVRVYELNAEIGELSGQGGIAPAPAPNLEPPTALRVE